MTNYIPHYTKKQAILERNEAKLRNFITRGEAFVRIIEMAETVRASRIRALRAKRATLPPTDGPHAARLAKLDRQIEMLQATPLQRILAEFGYNG